MAVPRIAIIGAGPGGLALASLLQRNAMQCTIFELDHDRHSRDQGGMVDLHGDSGQIVLREAGLFDEFQKHACPAAEAMKLVKSDGTVCWDENNKNNVEASGQSRDRPEVDRAALRDILLDSVNPGSIQWNRKLIRVEPTEAADAKYDLHFADRVEPGFDLVVGADGAWSRVRLLLTEEVPFYSGITFIELKAREVSRKNKWLADFTGQGTCFMFDEGRALICQRQNNDSIRVYAGVRQPETWAKDCGIDWTQHDAAKKKFTEDYFGDCHEDLKRVIAVAGSDGLKPWPLFMLPVGLKWSPRPGITLLGDAAHLMTPFAGVGVNVALTDALDLAHALLRQKTVFETDLHGALADALLEYEESMFERAKENMEKSAGGLKGHFSSSGIDDRVEKLQRRQKMMEERARKMEEAKQHT